MSDKADLIHCRFSTPRSAMMEATYLPAVCAGSVPCARHQADRATSCRNRAECLGALSYWQSLPWGVQALAGLALGLPANSRRPSPTSRFVLQTKGGLAAYTANTNTIH